MPETPLQSRFKLFVIGRIFFIVIFIMLFGCSREYNPVKPPADSSWSNTDIDGNEYHTITIGAQVWMVENLKVTHYRNGDAINTFPAGENWGSHQNGAFCNYNNDTSKVTNYGQLYNWFAVNDPRGLAPEGWHIPTYQEWQNLINTLGDEDMAGEKLIKTETAPLDSVDALNNNCFSALPGGYCDFGGVFRTLGSVASFWTATLENDYNVWHLSLSFNDSTLHCYKSSKKSGFSVRCIRN